ncbi:facilitated trehalose transporter Tret1-like isoform X2 [Metopolophium dirhodum]|uniref:facilitated trehalose transporter Tret1-like isoform X2 n=1 Tax=Metopolophium dirhodum TaxID=44670 RepID=UPI00298FF81E|nr:facilitated trehalose transporter Tret1-like isoform X2 [Metopolophium dirhodum]
MVSTNNNYCTVLRSLLNIFHPVGSFVSGFLQERFGRKRCIIFANFPSIFGWILLYYTHSAVSLYASTILMGLSIGFSEAPILSYVGEITEPRLRGSMASLTSTAPMLGVSFLFTLAYFFEWQTVALLSTFCPITSICLVTLIPESPIWLVAKGEYEKAEKALCWLRGWVKPEVVKTEYLELVRYNEISGTQQITPVANQKNLFSKLAQFKDPSVYRPLRLIIFYFLISIIVSTIPWRPFISKIMTEVGLSNNQSLLLVAFAVLQNIGCVIVVLTVHCLGKRFLTNLTFSINTLLLFLFGIYIIAIKNGYICSTPWIPITILCGVYFFGASVIILPWMALSEVFPNKSRGIAIGLSAGLLYLLIFVLRKSYLAVEALLTLEYTMVFFGFFGIFGSLYLYFFLPETENKTLLEIEEFFK